MLVPLSSDEVLAGCEEVARAIGSQYVVAYKPKRPLAAAAAREEYRRIDTAARRAGLTILARRGYVVPPPPGQ